MKKLVAMAVAAGVLAIAAPASAQSWQSINQRQANLEHRIDAGVRNGSLTRREAAELRADLYALARLEAHYRASRGLSLVERRDLDQRFDALSARIRYERHDRDDWRGRQLHQEINARQHQIYARIDAGERNGRLSNREAQALRTEFTRISQLELRYARNGLSRSEARDLHARLDALEGRVYAALNNRWRG